MTEFNFLYGGVSTKLLQDYLFSNAYYVMHTQKNYYFLLAKFTAEDLELLRLFEIESAANYLQRIEEEKRTGTEERVRRTSER